MTDNPFKIGDPVVDLAQGRPMVVLDAPDETVREWSDRENYDLTDNYANGKLGAIDDEPVVRCVYVSDIRSEPSKDYTFPISRVALIDAHHADDGRRLYDRVAVEVLARAFESMHRYETFEDHDIDAVARHIGGVAPGVVEAARELADVEQTIQSDD
jgi:hypothetical protein